MSKLHMHFYTEQFKVENYHCTKIWLKKLHIKAIVLDLYKLLVTPKSIYLLLIE